MAWDHSVRNICDCHFHVLGPPKQYEYRLNHVYSFEPAPLADYLAAVKGVGIERYVLVQPSIYERNNRCLLDTLEQLSPNSARGIVAIGEDISISELKSMHERGVRGVRFNLVQGPNFDAEFIGRIAKRVCHLGWHLELYTQGERLAALESDLPKIPGRIVIDHMGHIGLGTPDEAQHVSVLRRLLDSKRVWLKLIGYRSSIAGYPYEDVDPLARLLVAQYSKRCVWGTDWPVANFKGRAPTPYELRAALARWSTSDSEQVAILVDNPAEIYDFAS